MGDAINLADPDFEPTDEQLMELSKRAFADVKERHETALARLARGHRGQRHRGSPRAPRGRPQGQVNPVLLVIAARVAARWNVGFKSLLPHEFRDAGECEAMAGISDEEKAPLLELLQRVVKNVDG